MSLPTTITAGDTFSYVVTSATYTNSDGYTVYLKLRGAGSIDLTGTATTDSEFTITETAANTANWTAGFYKYVIYASDGTNEYTLDTGTTEVTLRADLDPTTDIRSHAQKVLDAIEAVIEGRASTDQQSYTINGRSLTRMTVDDLLKFRRLYKQEVKKEQGKYRSKLLIRM